MRRLLALVLAQALVVSTAGLSLAHVHDYSEHDHPEHHHGPAVHGHGHATSHDEHESGSHGTDDAADGAGDVRLESCDPGSHSMAVRASMAPVPSVHHDSCECPPAVRVISLASTPNAAAMLDVRVHGPPPQLRRASRAPPLTTPA